MPDRPQTARTTGARTRGRHGMFAPLVLTPASPDWPASLAERLGEAAPRTLHLFGPLALLAAPRTALFCSAHTPGATILPTHDARRLRDDGVTVISGFHSPLERDCLGILLRGRQPVILCPARAIDGYRLPPDLRAAFDAGRLLVLSPFNDQPRRVTRASARRRGEVGGVGQRGDHLAHVTPGGETARLATRLRAWGVPLVGAGAGSALPGDALDWLRARLPAPGTVPIVDDVSEEAHADHDPAARSAPSSPLDTG